MSSLFEKCDSFRKDAQNPQMVAKKNSDPVFKELSDIREFKERIEFAKDHWEFLGEGSSRTAFQINENLIIKVAHNDKGVAQNKVEMSPDVQRECVNNAVVADAEGKWIIFHSTEELNKEKFKELVGFTFETFMNALFYAMNNESDKWSEPREFAEIKCHPLFLCLANLVFNSQLLIGDLDKISSWGILNGKPVLRDAGLDKDTFKKYYKDEGSSGEPATSES